MVDERTQNRQVRGARGGRRPWWLVVLTMVLGVSMFGLTGCLGSDGSSGPAGAPGDPGTPAPGAPVPPGQVLPSVAITDAYVQNGRPVVEFEVTAQLASGLGLTFEPPPGDVEFTVARLVNKDGYQTWQSYLTTVSNPAAPRTGDHARLQASQVRGNHTDGTWESLGGNRYRYTYPVDVTAVPAEYQNGVAPVTAADWVPASQIDIRRFVVLLRPGSTWEAAYAYKDVGLGASKRSVATASCNNCHDNLAAHGSNRIGTETCSNCHNQFNFSSFTAEPNAVDLAYLGHEIHSGGGRADTEQYLRPRWTGVAFPRDLATCVSCHDSQTAGTGAERAFLNPSIQACGSCHDNVDFSQSHWGDVRTNQDCASCHHPDSGPNIAGRTMTLVEVHQNPAREFARAGNLRYVIDDASLAGDTLTVEWGVEYDGNRVIHGNGWAFAAAIRVGWFETDFTHSDTGSGRPGSPVEQTNAQNTATVANGTYTSTVDLAGQGVADKLYVTLGGNVATADHPQLVASNAVHVAGGTPRRTVVALANCTTCHEDRFGVFNKHGGNRHNDVQQCILCHNNNSTDIDRREINPRPYISPPHPDGKTEQATNFMVMVHGLHGTAAGVREQDLWIPGFGSWSHWDGDSSFPGQLANCRQCHVGDTFYPVARALEPRGTTVDSQSGSSDVDTHWKMSAAMAACSSCHDSSNAEAHMLLNGSVAGTDWDQPAIDASSYETCSTCHGPGRTADVKVVHGLRD